MLRIGELNLGFADAENYQRRENKELFNEIFVKNTYLESILEPNTFFLLGEKGTGKTAYAVFLSNNHYKETISELKYIRETDYQKFVKLKQQKHLELSDYSNVWKVIILLLLSKSLSKKELDHSLFSKNNRINALFDAIDEYHLNAFSPEIISVLSMIENSKETAEIITKYLKHHGEKVVTTSFTENKFQINLKYIQMQFEKALSCIKIKNNHLLFIDGIDIRPGVIEYSEYLECVKGLADAVWSLNNDFFSRIKDSTGRFKVVLLLRPDIFSSIGLQNSTNKIRDNAVLLDWRTTYPASRTSYLFKLSDKLLLAQQKNKSNKVGETWDHYFPWTNYSKNNLGNYIDEPSFYSFLRLSYSRPRDIVSIIKILQEEHQEQGCKTSKFFKSEILFSNSFMNKYSEYLLGGIKDQLSFYYDSNEYETFLKFFVFLNGLSQFKYEEYLKAYNEFVNYVGNGKKEMPEFAGSSEEFLQFLYDANIICYIECMERECFFRWCYRERSISNISPKVSPNMEYRIHYGLHKALNVGNQKQKK